MAPALTFAPGRSPNVCLRTCHSPGEARSPSERRAWRRWRLCVQNQGSIFILRNRMVPAVGGSAPAHAVHACPQVGAEALPRDRMLVYARTRMYAHRRRVSLPRIVLCRRALKVSFSLGTCSAGGTRATLRPRTAGGGAGLTLVGIRVCSSGVRADTPPRLRGPTPTPQPADAAGVQGC